MTKILINNNKSLTGNVEVSGSKNAVLPLLAATLLTDEQCILDGVPNLRDVEVMCQLLESFGAEVNIDHNLSRIEVRAANIKTCVAQQELVKAMRASIVAMGPLLARMGQAGIPLPGGCAIGERPIDLHLKGFSALGAIIINEEQDTSGDILISASANNLTGAEVYLDFASVGATENIMMAATLAEGTTIIENPAQEPEIVDLANFLNKMGAHIRGAGTDNMRIEGVGRLHGAEHCVIPDRIEAATFMLAAAITHGDVVIENMLSNHVIPVIAKLKECGVKIEDDYSGIRVNATNNNFCATNIKTLPYPGFPTDVQPQFMAFLATVPGQSLVLETVFENRFMHIRELNLMNANILEEGRRAVINGGAKLVGAHVRATDLRAGAALVLAGLVAEGTTEVSDIYHIDRGYDNLVRKLAGLGAGIIRIGSA